MQRELGPGLLESACEECRCHGINLQGLNFRSQLPVPVVDRFIKLDCGYKAGLIVEEKVLLELKAVERLLHVYESQLQTSLRLTGIKIGFLTSFDVPAIKNGI